MTEGLRERKKRATRRAISDAATALFMEKGFDATTVIEVADTVGVSAQTVQNYFPTKSDLFFDEPEWYLGPARAVRDRCPASPLGAAVLEWYVVDLQRRHDNGHLDGLATFIETIDASETLRRRRLEDFATSAAAMTAAVKDVYPDRPRWEAALFGALVTAAITVAESEIGCLSRKRSGRKLLGEATHLATQIIERSAPSL